MLLPTFVKSLDPPLSRMIPSILQNKPYNTNMSRNRVFASYSNWDHLCLPSLEDVDAKN